MSERTRSSKRRWAVVIAVGAAFVITFGGSVAIRYLYSAYRIPSFAMSPTIPHGSRVIARHLAGRAVHRGDIVVFRGILPTVSVDPLGSFRQGASVAGFRTSRVIAIGGDHVDAVDGHVRIDGRVLSERYLAPDTTTEGLQSVVIPSGMVFLMGDNRANARDSRSDGPVAATKIVGRIDYVNVPLDWIALALAGVFGATFVVLFVRQARRSETIRRPEPDPLAT